LQQQNFDFGYYINPDDIAVDLSGSYEERVRQAQVLADQQRQRQIASSQSFSFETYSHIQANLTIWSLLGERVSRSPCLFVGVDEPAINVERVRSRVQLGGHGVPEDRTMARYARTMALLPDIVERVDRAMIFDNSVQSDDPRAYRGRLIAQCLSNDNNLVVQVRSLVPAWTNRYLIEPAKRRGWALAVDDTRWREA